MSKKKEEKLQYLQVPLPDTKQNHYRSIKLNWGGLNRRNEFDTGELSFETNISTKESPYLTPSEKRIQYCDIVFPNPIGLFGFDDCLFVVNWDKNVLGDSCVSDEIPAGLPQQYGIYGNLWYHQNGEYDKKLVGKDFILLTRLKNKKNKIQRKTRIMNNGTDIMDMIRKKEVQRSIVRFNVYEDVDSPLTSDVYQKILIYPDKICNSNDKFSDDSTFEISSFAGSVYSAIPDIQYATVFNSRVFGVTNNTVFASGYNSYLNYKMDTVLYSSAENAWYSTSQSNTKGDGEFTGIASYGGHVICFKKDFMHEIYNTKNPFRIHDIYAEGCIDNRTIQDVDGTLFFVSEDNVKVYTGGNPEIVSYNLGIKKFKNCCAGNDGRNYYLYCEDEKDRRAIFVFDTLSKKWSQQEIEDQVVGFANTTDGMFLLTKYAVVTQETDESTGTQYSKTSYYGKIYKIDTENYDHDWSFETDVITSLSNTRTVDIKHVKKLQMLCDFSENSRLKVYAVYDGEDFNQNSSHLLCDISGKKGIYPVRIVVRKSANRSFKLHFEGYGYIKLYEMEVVTTEGGTKDVSG